MRSRLLRGLWGRTMVRRSSGLVVPADPLVALSDDFDGGSSDIEARGWQIYNPGLLAVSEVASGRYRHTPIAGNTAGSFWFNGAVGYLVFHDIEGDCDTRARVDVQNATFTGLPPATQFRLFGIAAHNPDRSTVLNYIHTAAGAVGGVYAIETKTTVDSVSTFPGAPVTPTTPWIVDLRLLRVGSLFTTMYRNGPSLSLEDNTGWTTHQAITRADLPAGLQWGMMCYANPTGHQIGGDVLEIRFSTPS